MNKIQKLGLIASAFSGAALLPAASAQAQSSAPVAAAPAQSIEQSVAFTDGLNVVVIRPNMVQVYQAAGKRINPDSLISVDSKGNILGPDDTVSTAAASPASRGQLLYVQNIIKSVAFNENMRLRDVTTDRVQIVDDIQNGTNYLLFNARSLLGKTVMAASSFGYDYAFRKLYESRNNAQQRVQSMRDYANGFLNNAAAHQRNAQSASGALQRVYRKRDEGCQALANHGITSGATWNKLNCAVRP